jgi:hypothetical protein
MISRMRKLHLIILAVLCSAFFQVGIPLGFAKLKKIKGRAFPRAAGQNETSAHFKSESIAAL